MRIPVVMAVAAAACSACSSPGDLRAAAESARAAVLAVRPAADLEGVRVEVWTRSTDLRALAEAEAGSVSLPELAAIFEAQAPVLTELALLDTADVDEFREEFLGLGETGIAGLAFPSSGVILVPPQSSGSIDVLAHEFGHIASARMGYGETTRARVFLRADRGPAWANVDALVASWLVNEGDAEFTGRMAAAFLEEGEAGSVALWQRPVPPEEPDLVGPATITRPDGSEVVLEKGEGYIFPKSILATWTKLAYGGSLALVVARRVGDEDLEATLRRTWEGFSFTTREVLFPDAPVESSRFALACKSLEAEASGATRVGALLVRDMLERKSGLSRRGATDLVAALEDDLVLRSVHGGLLWVTTWSDSVSARRFSDLYGVVLPGAARRTDGHLAVVVLGEVPDVEALLARLQYRGSGDSGNYDN